MADVLDAAKEVRLTPNQCFDNPPSHRDQTTAHDAVPHRLVPNPKPRRPAAIARLLSSSKSWHRAPAAACGRVLYGGQARLSPSRPSSKRCSQPLPLHAATATPTTHRTLPRPCLSNLSTKPRYCSGFPTHTCYVFMVLDSDLPVHASF